MEMRVAAVACCKRSQTHSLRRDVRIFLYNFRKVGISPRVCYIPRGLTPSLQLLFILYITEINNGAVAFLQIGLQY